MAHRSPAATIQRDEGDPCYVPNADSPYVHLAEASKLGSNMEFDEGTKNDIYDENNSAADAVDWDDYFTDQRDDYDDEPLVQPSEAKPMHSAVDHIVPFSLGGCNSVRNAQVLSKPHNSSKGATFPSAYDTGYTGKRVLVPDVMGNEPHRGNVISEAVAEGAGLTP
ncbi:MAG: HNH endonuclease signature motif containing protein [Actinomycetota bacterium]